MNWNWPNFWLGAVRSTFLAFGLSIVMGEYTIWQVFGAMICFTAAIEMSVHLVRWERIAEGKEKADG